MRKQLCSEEQIALFEAIKLKNKEESLVAVISRLLQVSADPAYKRISGKVPLTLPELKILRGHFGISIDEHLDGGDTRGLNIHVAPVDVSDTDGYHEYLKRLIGELCKLNTSGMEFAYTAHDIPIYHICRYPELIFFRMYARKDPRHHPGVPFTAFYKSLNKEKIMSLYEQLHAHSVQIPSTEIWCSQTVDHVLGRIKYFHDAGAFEHRDVPLRLLGQVRGILDTVHGYVKTGFVDAEQKKPFRMYVCAVDPDYDVLLAMKDAQPYYAITHVLNNRFGTFDRTLCDNTHQWVRDLKSKSIRISNDLATKEKGQFFRSATAKIEHLKNEILAGR